ncbi:50S ribosomal protein L29 [archaeon]|jgi:ribosomal protein L29|nr:50S ribosomal protein L29 [archaeon]
MAKLKAKDIKNMKKDEIEKKLKELQLELIKSKGKSSQGGGAKNKEIKRTIARILTINK